MLHPDFGLWPNKHIELKINKHNAELQWADPNKKVVGQFSTLANNRPIPEISFPKLRVVICMFCIKATTDDVLIFLKCQNNADYIVNNTHVFTTLPQNSASHIKNEAKLLYIINYFVREITPFFWSFQ